MICINLFINKMHFWIICKVKKIAFIADFMLFVIMLVVGKYKLQQFL